MGAAEVEGEAKGGRGNAVMGAVRSTSGHKVTPKTAPSDCEEEKSDDEEDRLIKHKKGAAGGGGKGGSKEHWQGGSRWRRRQVEGAERDEREDEV